MHLKQFGIVAVSTIALLFVVVTVSAWTGPTATAPNGNVSAPINVGSLDQVKNANLGVNGLAVFGNSLLQASSYLNWGSTSGAGGYGIRDNGGQIEIKSVGGSWATVQSTVQALVGSGTGIVKFGGVYSSGAAATNAAIVFTGAANSAPSYSGGVLTLPSNTSYYTVELWGAGGGGAGASANVGGTGGTSCFGSSSSACSSPIMYATGGGGGLVEGAGGAGGVGVGGDISLQGGGGGGGGNNYDQSGTGGNAPRGGGGGYGYGNAAAGTGIAGASFGGGGSSGTTGHYSGGGGGGGGYVQKTISGTATEYFTIGAGGAAGAAGSYAGGPGGAGGIAITVYTSN